VSTQNDPSAETSLIGAGVGRRITAGLLDLAVSIALIFAFVFVVVRPIMIALLVPEGAGPVDPRLLWAAATPSTKAIVILLFFASTWIAPGLYYAFLESGSRQATLGKRALDLVALRSNGNAISFLRATGRFYVKTVITWIPGGFITLLPMFGKRQGLHDWLTSVVVVHRPATAAQSGFPVAS
jgi:uncharacterized RDD family membrane protein YckC